MSERADDLGRAEGVWVPVDDVPTHIACGWKVADDVADGVGPRDELGHGCMLLAPPAGLEAVA